MKVITRIPLTIVSSVDGATTNGVLVGVLAADLDALEAELDAAQLRSIEARNPGIDMDEVKRSRAALSTQETL